MNLIRQPDEVTVLTQSGDIRDTVVDFKIDKSVEVLVTAKEDLVRYIKLRWNMKMPESVKILGDAWERGYGDLEWRGYHADRPLPWYFLISDLAGKVSGVGVKVRPAAMCAWNVDEMGITLLLDVRNGCKGVRLGGRKLKAAEVVACDYEGISEFEAACDFCGVMCTDAILPKKAVYGSNNWYYAYGKSSHEEIIEDASYIAELTEGLENRPYMVIDDGWSPKLTEGPWDCGNERFPDMKRLAKEIADFDVIPGIWIRCLCDRSEGIPKEWYLREQAGYLDPSHPEVIKKVSREISQLNEWGYKLIKHDFSTFDIFGHYGFAMDSIAVRSKFGFYDDTKTTAEIILNFYKTILDNAGDALILGCNCIGHLCAGLAHLNRIGDDTSGIFWERTRKMGVNTLAFRLCQNKKFFDVDGDCVGITAEIPWELNRGWLYLLSRSGTSLFVSSKKGVLPKEHIPELKEAFRVNSIQKDTMIPLDWLTTTTPRRYLINGEEMVFNWNEKAGISKYIQSDGEDE